MKTVIVAMIAIVLMGCEQSGSSGETTNVSTDPDQNVTTTTPVDLSMLVGLWNPVTEGNLYKWCFENQSDGTWSCHASETPDACNAVWPYVDSYSVMAMGLHFDGTMIQMSTNQTVSYDSNTGTMSLSPSGMQWGIREYNGQAILSYGTGCSILYEKTY